MSDTSNPPLCTYSNCQVTPTNTSLREELTTILRTLESKVVSDYRDAMRGQPGLRTFGSNDDPRGTAVDQIEALLTAKTTEARISELDWALSRLAKFGKETDSQILNRAIDEIDDNIAQLQQLDKGEA